jgi:hypothetical protein
MFGISSSFWHLSQGKQIFTSSLKKRYFVCTVLQNVIPEGKSKWGRFYELRDKVDQAIKSKYTYRVIMLHSHKN